MAIFPARILINCIVVGGVITSGTLVTLIVYYQPEYASLIVLVVVGIMT
jgi:hypothetical protein